MKLMRLIEAEDYTNQDKYWGDRGAGVIFQFENQILLGLRSKDVNEPNTWGIIGGMIEDGESPKQAAKREVREEASVYGNYPLKLLYIYKDKSFSYYDFLVIVKEKFVPKPSYEMVKFKWFELNNLPKNLHFGVKKFLPSLIKITKKINENKKITFNKIN